ncbi:type II toxin-antitoxin system MqsA family antitoxin [Methylophilus sp. VKM B-3414]|uniref:helix-turn-helix domain-containing protein n=1 Tax=unclassified Methylophilus TaxID=2630143 RepID=UPI0028C6B257|nr:type II toxin-antitoxin system MqsA family antitoxin [Methylophilus sp. VKM B-3414]MDT7848205.1 type II toxin-antitoxin system MqsA family antitoxin [Methylophilus sp. VKM B-3414]
MTKVDQEMAQFKADLLTSVKELKAGKVARSTQVDVSFVVSARNQVGLSQSEFAQLLGVSVRTLQAWEQGRIKPSGAAQTLMRIAHKHPEVLLEVR